MDSFSLSSVQSNTPICAIEPLQNRFCLLNRAASSLITALIWPRSALPNGTQLSVTDYIREKASGPLAWTRLAHGGAIRASAFGAGLSRAAAAAGWPKGSALAQRKNKMQAFAALTARHPDRAKGPRLLFHVPHFFPAPCYPRNTDGNFKITPA
jgi:hypothetical protein